MGGLDRCRDGARALRRCFNCSLQVTSAQSMFRAIIYNRLRLEIDSEKLATWQDAVQWLAQRPGNERKWSEIINP